MSERHPNPLRRRAPRALPTAGVLLAPCDPKFDSKIPTGCAQGMGAVEGCLLTDFLPA
ncbi:hypothetical protein [Streptomyces sp. NPDC057939]|uniref:hypothetical protein n=1 Tax=Streptomyces sp. NPDC057939 TaxID=3346284 RepID=UPI0036E2EA1D